MHWTRTTPKRLSMCSTSSKTISKISSLSKSTKPTVQTKVQRGSMETKMRTVTKKIKSISNPICPFPIVKIPFQTRICRTVTMITTKWSTINLSKSLVKPRIQRRQSNPKCLTHLKKKIHLMKNIHHLLSTSRFLNRLKDCPSWTKIQKLFRILNPICQKINCLKTLHIKIFPESHRLRLIRFQFSLKESWQWSMKYWSRSTSSKWIKTNRNPAQKSQSRCLKILFQKRRYSLWRIAIEVWKKTALKRKKFKEITQT